MATSTDQNLISPSHAFFANLIDYAGLYPPATLKLSPAIENYIEYQFQKHARVLGRFVLSPSHLEEIACLDLPPFQVPLQLSLVTRNPSEDLARIKPILPTLKEKATIGSVEVALDVTASGVRTNSMHLMLSLTEASIATLDEFGSHPSLFLEIPPCTNWDELLLPLLETTSKVSTSTGRIIGFKLRCGGNPEMVPSPKRVARVLRESAAHNVSLKFTAGLHSPFYHAEQLNGATILSHGFFNIFFAAFLAYRSGQPEDLLERIVQESSSITPEFTNSALNWLGHSFSAVEIAQLRAAKVTSFGSCSFDEPIEEATKRGWL